MPFLRCLLCFLAGAVVGFVIGNISGVRAGNQECGIVVARVLEQCRTLLHRAYSAEIHRYAGGVEEFY